MLAVPLGLSVEQGEQLDLMRGIAAIASGEELEEHDAAWASRGATVRSTGTTLSSTTESRGAA
eukprot:270259-Pyramimonas_sp.AAC.1